MYSDDIKAGPESSQTYDYAKRLQAAKDFFKEVSPDNNSIPKDNIGVMLV
jgi:hypothetical protein